MSWIVHIDSKPEEGLTVLQLIGRMDEHTQFQNIPLTQDHFVVDCSMLEGINSLGIRAWIQWVRQLKYKSFRLEKCPKLMVDQFGQVVGFLQENMLVDSFEVPYVSIDGELEKRIYFHREKEFTMTGILTIPEVRDHKGQLMEVDVIPEKYFSFLKAKKS